MGGSAVDAVMAGFNGGLMGAGFGGALGAIFPGVCFVAGTQVVEEIETGENAGSLATDVSLAEGGTAIASKVGYRTRNVEQVRRGDVIISRDQNDPFGPLVHSHVEQVYKRLTYHLRILRIGDPADREQTLQTTDEHPFDTRQKGWVKACKLEVGDVFSGPFGESGTLLETYREEHPEGVWVYNLRIGGTHTYFVREEGVDAQPVWAHNAGPGYEVDQDDLAAYIEQRTSGRPDWDSINPDLTVRQQSAIRAAAREQGVEIPTPNPYGCLGDPISKRTGTYVLQELENQGFDVRKEYEFDTPGSLTKDSRFADVFGINEEAGEAAIVQVVRTTDAARVTPDPREFDAMNDILASPDYQALIDQGYAVTGYMVRRGATSLGSGTIRTF